MKLSLLIAERLASLGVQRPSPALILALEARLAPRIADLVNRTLTTRVVALAFAETLVEAKAQGSPEGCGEAAPALASSPDFSCSLEREKTPGVSGAPENQEAM